MLLLKRVDRVCAPCRKYFPHPLRAVVISLTPWKLEDMISWRSFSVFLKSKFPKKTLAKDDKFTYKTVEGGLNVSLWHIPFYLVTVFLKQFCSFFLQVFLCTILMLLCCFTGRILPRVWMRPVFINAFSCINQEIS